jgi:hypothetical protein
MSICCGNSNRTNQAAKKSSLENLFEINEIINLRGSFSNPIYSFYNAYITPNKIYLPDSFGHVINIYEKDGKFLFRLGTDKGNEQGAFQMPYGVIIDKDGFIYVNDRGNKRIQIFDPSLNFFKEIIIHAKSPIETLMLTKDSNIIVVAVAPTFAYSKKQRCLMQELDSKGNVLKIFGFFNQYFISYSWATAIDEKDQVYVCNIFERTIYIYASSREFLRKVKLSSPSFIALKTKVSRRAKTLSDYIEKSRAFSQELHTTIIRLYVKDERIFVLHKLTGGKIQTPEFLLDIFDLEGKLLYYGIKIPGEIFCFTDKFYFIENVEKTEYGSAKITGIKLKRNIQTK